MSLTGLDVWGSYGGETIQLHTHLSAQYLGGLMLGHGLFETVKITAGEPEFLLEHWERMQKSARCFGKPLLFDFIQFKEALTAFLQGYQAAVYRLNLIYLFGNTNTLLLRLRSYNEIEAPILLKLSEEVVFSRQQKRRHKTLSYFEPLQSLDNAKRANVHQELFFNEHGRVVCSSVGNVWIKKGDKLYTPPIDDGVLPGVIRRKILKGQFINIEAKEHPLVLSDVVKNELFISNSLLGLSKASLKEKF